MWDSMAARRGGGQEGQLPPGARRRGRQKRVVAAKEGATNMTFAPGARNPGAATGGTDHACSQRDLNSSLFKSVAVWSL
jgi:hypothetical protein